MVFVLSALTVLLGDKKGGCLPVITERRYVGEGDLTGVSGVPVGTTTSSSISRSSKVKNGSTFW